MIYRACVICGRRAVGPYCETHKPVPFAGSTRRKRLPSDWQRRRRTVLTAHPCCQICGEAPATEVDHIVPGDDHRLVNLRGVCSPCHRSKSGREGQAAQ